MKRLLMAFSLLALMISCGDSSDTSGGVTPGIRVQSSKECVEGFKGIDDLKELALEGYRTLESCDLTDADLKRI